MLQDLVHLNESGWWWPNSDEERGRGAWIDLFYNFSKTPEKIASICQNKRVIVQAGGNCGIYVKKYAELFETVYTFEPDPVNFYCLNLNVTNANVYKFQAAVGVDRECISIFNEMPYNAGAGHVKRGGVIPTIRIDDLGLLVCDVIQLDIEGFELYALQGAIETIKRCKPIIVLEYFWESRYGVTRGEIEKLLVEIGYKVGGTIPESQNDVYYAPVEEK